MFITSGDQALGANWIDFAAAHQITMKVRPSSLYSEPSYFGLILLFLHVIILTYRDASTAKKMSIFILATGVLIQSGLAVLSNLVVVIYFYSGKNLSQRVIAVSVTLLLIAIFAIGDVLPQRVGDILAGTDGSANIRLFEPFNVIGEVLTKWPFGFPLSGAASYYIHVNMIPEGQDTPFQNGLLNLIISFGWLSPFILVPYFRGATCNLARLFLLFAIAQNGGPIEVDKLVLMSIISLVITPSVSEERYKSPVRQFKWNAYTGLRAWRRLLRNTGSRLIGVSGVVRRSVRV
jgi:hypothetical protein